MLWITSEDNSPLLGCYGDKIARTPHIDAFAKDSSRYSNCFSNAAVCAPARQTLITGMYATSLGGQHMRSSVRFPKGVSYFPKYLKEAGYYTTNNSKTDYNGAPAESKAAMTEAWNESNNKAHWRNRPNKETPFFAVFNIADSHESNLFPSKWRKRELKTDPSTVTLPDYLPDTPATRLDLARYYDCLESMDSKVGKILRQLDDDGLTGETIVFYFSDHGGSMPRGKSFIYVSSCDPKQLPELQRAMTNDNPCLLYWGVTGCVVLGQGASSARTDLLARLEDDEPVIQIQAARALAGMGAQREAIPIIRKYTEGSNSELALLAVLAIDECQLLAAEPRLRNSVKTAKGSYTKRVVDRLLSNQQTR